MMKKPAPPKDAASTDTRPQQDGPRRIGEVIKPIIRRLQSIPTMRIDLDAEFDRAVANLNADHFRHLAAAGVSFEAVCRAGYVGIERIATTGRLYMPAPDGSVVLIMAVWAPAPPSIYCTVETPVIMDLIAFRTDAPATWWYRIGEPGLILGEDRYLAAVDGATPLKVYDSPLRWLQGGCDGTVFLDDGEVRWAAERFAEDEAALQAWWGAAA